MCRVLRFLARAAPVALALCLLPPDALGYREAEIKPLAHRSLVLGVALAGDRLVAVGERGHILLSGDYGKTWRQVPVRTRATFTAVHFVSDQTGWAVGHDNAVFRTDDSGETWTAKHVDGGLANRFLDVFFLDQEHGFAIGAYGLFVETRDGGRRWERREIFDEELHFNRLSRAPDGRLFIAAEMGELLESVDDGATWEPMDSPYEGSLFGVLPLGAQTLLTYGLRGNVFRSRDGGGEWHAIETPTPVLITDAVRLASGPVILAGQNEQFFISRDAGRAFELWRVPVQGAAALVETPDGAIIAAGLNGLWRLTPPARAATPARTR